MQLHRLVVSWSGPAVKGLAVNVLHFDGTNQTAPPVPAVLAAYSNALGAYGNGTTVTVPGTGDSIDDTTGQLTGVWSTTGGGSVTQPSTQWASAAGVGACISWSTSLIVPAAAGHRARRLRGRTFMVPLSLSMYEADGTIISGGLTILNTWAAAMRASGPLAVWHRPTSVTATDGTSAPVVGHKLSDRVAFLSSRRS
jgi:hypothetical protein